MDHVYLVRPGVNPELRYSLRSISTRVLAPGKVWIIGDPPDWVDHWEAYVLPSHPEARTPGEATTSHLLRACGTDEISDPFILMNDDFFCLSGNPSKPPLWDRGPLQETMIDLRFKHRNNPSARPYLDGMARTLGYLDARGFVDPLCYDFHAPLVVHKSPMREALTATQGHPGLHKRTIYGNLAGLNSVSHEDVLIRERGQVVDPAWPWVATTDQSWLNHPVGDIIRFLYPNPSPFEVSC